MAEVELKVIINDVELEFEGEYDDMVKFYSMIKKDFLDKQKKSGAAESSKNENN